MYPNNALSAVQLVMIAVVVVSSLAAWLTMVLLADRPPRGASTAVNTRPHEKETGAAGTRLPHAAPPPPDKAAARWRGWPPGLRQEPQEAELDGVAPEAGVTRRGRGGSGPQQVLV